MNVFKKKAARRIALVSVLLALVASPIAGFVAREQAEEEAVSFAIEESDRLLRYHKTIEFDGAQATKTAQSAAEVLAGGLFDIVEIYNRHGAKLAETTTAAGERVESVLPRHHRPMQRTASYESLNPGNNLWVLRIFVPLKDTNGAIAGYFEGVRVVPDWQREQILFDALVTALMVGLASLICGGVLYPVVVYLAADNEAKARDVLESHIAMMEALGRAIAKRDSDTGAHNYRVAWISATLGEAAGLSGSTMQSLIAGSFLHDAGKIGIPDAILLKPGRLDDDEMATMRQHVALGEEIVSGAGWLDGAKDVVAAHHEKWDGSGYPRGLAGEDIPLAARVFAIADVFDALCSQRPYKAPLPFDETMEILGRGRGSHFDPQLLDRFTVMARAIHARTASTSEDEARTLMEQLVRKHFEL
ncbi:HD-GYP domain-containing protein [Denitratisoma oestradiolicum]|uniref:Metal-dependent phosphohydrolase n=1 Tax=Denitratisoma oestradiolicum TaxID=311182 RepID=A0A6S6Y6K2_9PROT|nr:HD domain-containing phosphohydrolase [Denitratisoma oestradiolicum]TWO79446.1 metal-dependent phosphohydrolase [Denitratisoma oestradiolicum]CAB1368158.1 Metal-dependent phosphohydrolase [Denitratisoma oestradiolicum]